MSEKKKKNEDHEDKKRTCPGAPVKKRKQTSSAVARMRTDSATKLVRHSPSRWSVMGDSDVKRARYACWNDLFVTAYNEDVLNSL
jgi:hypothetical protein